MLTNIENMSVTDISWKIILSEMSILFPPPTSSDEVYKAYFSMFQAALRSLETGMANTEYNGWMSDVVHKFKYFQHTSPKVMAIAKVLQVRNAGSNGPFDSEEALRLVDTLFQSDSGKDKNLIVANVYNYYERLTV